MAVDQICSLYIFVYVRQDKACEMSTKNPYTCTCACGHIFLGCVCVYAY